MIFQAQKSSEGGSDYTSFQIQDNSTVNAMVYYIDPSGREQNVELHGGDAPVACQKNSAGISYISRPGPLFGDCYIPLVRVENGVLIISLREFGA